jgi:hypothetical protein
MATVTFVLGLSGSGKTWLAERIKAVAKFDESFLGTPEDHQALVGLLKLGKDCVVVDIGYCDQRHRDAIVQEITAAVPDARINWLCIENDLHKANRNCWERKDKGDPEGHARTNQIVSPLYTYSDGAVILKMWTQG